MGLSDPSAGAGSLSQKRITCQFPKGLGPWSQLRAGAGKSAQGRPGSCGTVLHWVLFPTGSLGERWASGLTWPPLGELVDLLVDLCLLVGNACHRGSYTTVHFEFSTRLNCNGNWRLAFTVFAGLRWDFTRTYQHRDPQHREQNVEAHLALYF